MKIGKPELIRFAYFSFEKTILAFQTKIHPIHTTTHADYCSLIQIISEIAPK